MIRRAVPADAARLAAIHIESWQAAYAGLLPDEYLEGLSGEIEARTAQWQDWLSTDSPRRLVLVAVDGDEVVGFVHLGPAGDKDLEPAAVGEVYAMYLDPGHFRRGWGSRLMQSAFDQLRAVGVSAAVLWVMADNRAAQAFYEHHRWEADGATADQCLGITIPAVRYRVGL